MVVYDFNIRSLAFIPVEAYPPLFVDTDTELSFPISCQPFKLVIGWNSKKRQGYSGINLHQLATGNSLYVVRQPSGEGAVKYFFRLFTVKRCNHENILPHGGTNVKR